MKRAIFFPNNPPPNKLGHAAIEALRTQLAVDQQLAAATQNPALSAWRFLDRDVLNRPLDLPIDAICVTKPTRVPSVMTKGKPLTVIECLTGTSR